MANELQPLSQLFQNRLFRIPDYQRGYAWQQPQLADFWEDLVNLQDDRYHYTGLLSLKNLKPIDTKTWGDDLWLVEIGYKPCHIVDGQQRLTTFIILLNEIVTFVRALPENHGKKDTDIVLGYEALSGIVEKYLCRKRPPHGMITTYLFGYETDNPSAEYLRYKVFYEVHSGTVNETYYTKNLKFAKTFFADNLAALYAAEGVDGINTLYKKLTLRLMFNIHEIDDDYDVFVAFETMNNRGKKLTNLELLKNRLIYLTTLYDEEKCDKKDKEALRRQINDAWKEVYFQLGRNENTPLSDDEFLRAHWIIYFAYSRKKGDDYIRFLLRKFSAKNIFEKVTLHYEDAPSDAISDMDADDEADDTPDIESVAISKLEPNEIHAYVTSLMGMAKYWYDTYFPYESQILTDEEKRWVDRINRIGIGHFRPLVAAILSRVSTTDAEDRLAAFKAIERFQFVCFRLGTFNASYRSSEYYRAARSIYLAEMKISALANDINQVVNSDMEYAISNFVTRIEKRFGAGEGYYGWNSLRYFMYEYEYSLMAKNGIQKITWEMFSKTEKDKVSIEHILPQTPTKYYWRNQFRQFSKKEIETMAGALGNLLPLSQSVNSSLQNDSFADKKQSKTVGRRGYYDGSHSEIEVSKEVDWDAHRIYNRSVHLLQFMENRWSISISPEDMEKLVYIGFVNDGRPVPEVLSEEADAVSESAAREIKTEKPENGNLDLWIRFVDYCRANDRADIAGRKPQPDHWYDVPVGAPDFHLSFTATRNKYLTLVIYVYSKDAFERLEGKKETIEKVFGDSLEWYTSRKNSTAKRILYRRTADLYNPDAQLEMFDWMMEQYDAVTSALTAAGEISSHAVPHNKTDSLRNYLQKCGQIDFALAFSEIESIIGSPLCKSAYTYPVYWSPSPTHTMANAIIDGGYEIVSVDLKMRQLHLRKRT